MSRRKAMSIGCGGNGRKPRKDWSDVVGRCGPGERKRIEAGHARERCSYPRITAIRFADIIPEP